MHNILKYVVSGTLGCILVPTIALGAAENNAQKMPKDEWLSKIKKVIPQSVCKGFIDDASIAKRMKKMQMDYNRCVTTIPAITDTCEKKYYQKLPDMITVDSAAKWGQKIGECIGANFAMLYLRYDNEKEPEVNSNVEEQHSEPKKEH